jgi:hypothetical protein
LRPTILLALFLNNDVKKKTSRRFLKMLQNIFFFSIKFIFGVWGKKHYFRGNPKNLLVNISEPSRSRCRCSDSTDLFPGMFLHNRRRGVSLYLIFQICKRKFNILPWCNASRKFVGERDLWKDLHKNFLWHAGYLRAIYGNWPC